MAEPDALRDVENRRNEIVHVLRSLALVAATVVSMLAFPAHAQRLSERPIFIVVPFTPGSGPDVLARIVAEELKNRWNQPVVVENKPGASGNIGAAFAARAAPRRTGTPWCSPSTPS